MVARAAMVPVIEPSDSEEARVFIKRAFELSEQYDTPIIFRTTTRLAHSQGLVHLEERAELPDKPYEKNIAKNVMMPGNAIKRHLVVEDRLKRMAEDACTLDINKVEYKDTKIGVITSGKRGITGCFRIEAGTCSSVTKETDSGICIKGRYTLHCGRTGACY